MTRLGEDRWTNYAVTSAGCWEWQGYVAPNGYGRIYVPDQPPGQQIQWVHRAFYERHRGQIPAGHEIDHVCCNTICVNAEHLEAVTRTEHVRRTLARLGTYDRHQRAAGLRALGMTYAEIAEALAYSSKTSAHEAVMSAIDKGLADPDAIPRQRTVTPAEREDICALYEMGISQVEIAVWYRLDSSWVSRICARHRRKPEEAA